MSEAGLADSDIVLVCLGQTSTRSEAGLAGSDLVLVCLGKTSTRSEAGLAGSDCSSMAQSWLDYQACERESYLGYFFQPKS